MITIGFWIIFGGLVGWICALIDERLSRTQTVAYIALGIVGALFGGAIIHTMQGPEPLNFGVLNLLLPTAGAMIALYVAIQTRKPS